MCAANCVKMFLRSKSVFFSAPNTEPIFNEKSIQCVQAVVADLRVLVVYDLLVVDAGGHGNGNQKHQEHEQREHHAVVFSTRQANALRGRFRRHLLQRHVVPALVHLGNGKA